MTYRGINVNPVFGTPYRAGQSQAAPTPGVQAPSAYGASINTFGFDPSAKDYASQTFAALTRQQWADYVANYVPYENKLIEYATDPNVVTNAMTEASGDVNTAFDRIGNVNNMRLKGLGLSLNADEQHASDRTLGLARSAADVQGQNSARDVTRARQQSILGNPAPEIGATT
jgi:hypothetical protein